MPRVVKLSEADITWLREANATLTYKQMATHLSCCEDTLKRILVRHGIAEFSGAKYTLPRPAAVYWSRPCIRCRSTSQRPRMQYTCDSCHEKLADIAGDSHSLSLA
jgi:hypothetical protein